MTEPGIDTCGPGAASKYVWQGPGDSWIPACREHDRAYTYRDVPRNVADRDLLAGLLHNSAKPWQRLVAWGYYLAVRVGGWAFYYSSKNR